jgi:protein subunit release factor A
VPMKELHLTKKDFKLEWYSGEGSGGQHRNKHENCCRITHSATGISAVGTASKSRVTNQRDAFSHLAARLLDHYGDGPKPRGKDGGRVRTYHAERNEVLDHASQLSMRYSDVVGKGNIGPMIEARRKAKA